MSDQSTMNSEEDKMLRRGTVLPMVLAIPFFATTPVFTQIIDTLANVSVSAQVNRGAKTRVYSYEYTITNSLASSGSIDWFELDIHRPSGTAPLGMNGLKVGKTQITVDMDYAEQESLVTAVGVAATPGGWAVSISRGLRIIWSGEPMIKPGEQLSGFTIQSKGLPAIRSARIDPYFDVSRWPDIDELPTVDAADSVMRIVDSLRMLALPKHVKTVGPTNPPYPSDRLKLIDTLKSYTTQAYTLGWITNKKLADSYIEIFDSARVQLERKDVKAGRASLETVLKHVNRDSASRGTLTSESYALLRFNVEYLISSLSKAGEKRRH